MVISVNSIDYPIQPAAEVHNKRSSLNLQVHVIAKIDSLS